jgi:hypothetical protein
MCRLCPQTDFQSSFASTIGQTTGCPKDQKILFTGVAADCEYTKSYGSVENATTQVRLCASCLVQVAEQRRVYRF